MLPYRAPRVALGAAIAASAGILAAYASGRIETGYIAFTATVGALLAFARYLGERPSFSVVISPDDWPGRGDIWRFTFTNRSDREWHLMRAYLSESPRAQEGLVLGGANPTVPALGRVKPYQPFVSDVTVTRLRETFGHAKPGWAVLVDSRNDRHPVRLSWPD